MTLSRLSQRRLISLSGDVYPFLQGIVTQDVMQVRDCSPSCFYSLMLTPQGKFFCDFFIWNVGPRGVLIEIAEPFWEDFFKKLSQFNLRKQVLIQDVSEEFHVFVQYPETFCALETASESEAEPEALSLLVWCADPRWAGLGRRALGSPFVIASLQNLLSPQEHYQKFCRSQGVPDAATDLEKDRSIPLEFNLDELQALSWTKGCYMGQELMSRVKHRKLLRKRCLILKGPMQHLDRGTKLLFGEASAGTVMSFQDGVGLALISLEAYQQIKNLGSKLFVATSSVDGVIQAGVQKENQGTVELQEVSVEKPLWLEKSSLYSFLG